MAIWFYLSAWFLAGWGLWRIQTLVLPMLETVVPDWVLIYSLRISHCLFHVQFIRWYIQGTRRYVCAYSELICFDCRCYVLLRGRVICICYPECVVEIAGWQNKKSIQPIIHVMLISSFCYQEGRIHDCWGSNSIGFPNMVELTKSRVEFPKQIKVIHEWWYMLYCDMWSSE
jgi:hypothetical protein